MKSLSICDCINRESRRVPDLSQNFEIILPASRNLASNKQTASFNMLTVLESGIVYKKLCYCIICMAEIRNFKTAFACSNGQISFYCKNDNEIIVNQAVCHQIIKCLLAS